MDQEQDYPLSEKFYNSIGWMNNIIVFYEKKQDVLDAASLKIIVEQLVFCVETAIGAYGNSAYVMVDALEKTINPLYEPNEYQESVYNILKKAAVEEKDARLDRYAESLMLIRRLFEAKEEFIEKFFLSQIKNIPDEETKEKIRKKLIKFSRAATKTHINQIIRLMKEEQKLHIEPRVPSEG